MMKAREAISPGAGMRGETPAKCVPAATPLISALPLLLDSPGRELGVEDGGQLIGVIDQTSMLEGIGRMIAARDDCSVVTVECPAEDYSASRIARAVEDADVHLVDMLSVPAADGYLSVMLRVRCEDPTSVTHSLERYGYSVTEVSANSWCDGEAALERLMEVKALLDI